MRKTILSFFLVITIVFLISISAGYELNNEYHEKLLWISTITFIFAIYCLATMPARKNPDSSDDKVSNSLRNFTIGGIIISFILLALGCWEALEIWTIFALIASFLISSVVLFSNLISR